MYADWRDNDENTIEHIYKELNTFEDTHHEIYRNSTLINISEYNHSK